MIVPLSLNDYEELTGKPPPQNLRGWAWTDRGRITAALCLNHLGGRDWATEGLIGRVPDSLAAAQLVQQAADDLKQTGARIFVSFADLPGLRNAGTVLFYASSGLAGELKLATDPSSKMKNFDELVAQTQLNSADFKDIPSPENTLEPYQGYGDQLWRAWAEQGVILVNAIDSLTCHLAFVGLIERFRGRGHGQHLVEDALKLTGSNRQLTAAVDSSNEAACKIYQNLGFKLTGERPVRFRVF